MNKSIKYFNEISTDVLQNLKISFLEKPENFAEFSRGIQEELNELGKQIIKETFEDINEEIRQSQRRKEEWVIERTDDKDFITVFGKIKFKKTLFKNKSSSEPAYLLDRVLKLDPNERIAEDVKANMLEEAVQTSYRKAAEECSAESLTKQTTKNLLHNLEFPDSGYDFIGPKKKVEVLYIEADEDHLSLQFKERKGDIKTNKNGRKKNGLICKMIYVHEGIRPVAPSSTRNELIEPHYFCRVCHGGKENEKLWDEVYEYIAMKYDLRYIKKIYLSADGGKWIQAGANRLGNVEYVLDEFHLNKYIHKIACKFGDSCIDVSNYLKDVIKCNDVYAFNESIKYLKEHLGKRNGLAEITQSQKYILDNWDAANKRLVLKNKIYGCSAEGHISHVLADRMSSRPLGWCYNGASQCAHLREFWLNGGDMLDLVRYQKTYRIDNTEITEYYIPKKFDKKPLNTASSIAAKYCDTFVSNSGPGRKKLDMLEKIYIDWNN